MTRFNPAEQALIDVWETHTAAEFELKDADAAIATMTDRPTLIHVPVGTGATGRDVERTGRTMAVPHVGIIAFEDGKISSEHIYWDQATVLVQLGLLGKSFPVMGGDQKDRLLDPSAPANRLIERLAS
jgi:carboxymethylenebutenolidase